VSCNDRQTSKRDQAKKTPWEAASSVHRGDLPSQRISPKATQLRQAYRIYGQTSIVHRASIQRTILRRACIASGRASHHERLQQGRFPLASELSAPFSIMITISECHEPTLKTSCIHISEMERLSFIHVILSLREEPRPIPPPH